MQEQLRKMDENGKSPPKPWMIFFIRPWISHIILFLNSTTSMLDESQRLLLAQRESCLDVQNQKLRPGSFHGSTEALRFADLVAQVEREPSRELNETLRWWEDTKGALNSPPHCLGCFLGLLVGLLSTETQFDVVNGWVDPAHFTITWSCSWSWNGVSLW